MTPKILALFLQRPLFAQCRSDSNFSYILYLFLVYIVQKKLLTAGVELCSENIKDHTAAVIVCLKLFDSTKNI